MSGLSLQYDLSALDEINRHLYRLTRFDKRKLAEEIGSYVVDEIVDRLHAQRTFDGKHFIKSKAAKKRGGLTLIDTGALRDSYTYQAKTDGSEVLIGSDSDYAAIHHFGGMTGRGGNSKIEANPVLGLSEDNKREIGDMALDAIKRVLR